MQARLRLSIGHYSDKGRKPGNQDFLGAHVPKDGLLASRGVAAAISDGISSSRVSHIASQTAVGGFLQDYYCTPESWSVRTAVEKVLAAANSWLHAQSRHHGLHVDLEHGYVCTFSGMVFRSRTAHLFHVGDSRAYRLRDGLAEQLSEDHLVRAAEQRYLARALGMRAQLDLDYRAVQMEVGDLYLLATDGVYEHTDAAAASAVVAAHDGDLDAAARAMSQAALAQGSQDNLSVLLVRVDALPDPDAAEMLRDMSALPLPPLPQARMELDGLRLMRELHASSRSHVWLAQDIETGAAVVIKFPSVDLRDDPAYIERFLMEEWIARRLDSAHVLRPSQVARPRTCLYLVMEFIDGCTLEQWMIDNPRPALETVRGIVEQIARGLRAFHRLEMLHRDLRPANIMIDTGGTVKIIDFGAVEVAGIEELRPAVAHNPFPGSLPYMAPEYLLGEQGSPRADQFSLGVIAYQMLTGRLPYGTAAAAARTRSAQRRLQYRSALSDDRELAAWVDAALERAVQPEPQKRYEDISEFVHDLHHPNRAFTRRGHTPLIERNPLLFWKALSFMLTIAVLALLAGRG